MWTTAAPARAASIADSAICSGVTGTCGLRDTVSPAPVIAHVMKASFSIDGPKPYSLRHTAANDAIQPGVTRKVSFPIQPDGGKLAGHAEPQLSVIASHTVPWNVPAH